MPRASIRPTSAATGIGWALGFGRLGSILGVTVGGLMLAAQWIIPSLFQASAVPQLCSALVIVGLVLFGMRHGGVIPDETRAGRAFGPRAHVNRKKRRDEEMQRIETQVLIVGAGPVGLTAAMDLASRGINVVVAEIRRAGEPPNVKCNHVSARSMEVFRRLGIVRRVRDGGLPADFPNDCAYRTAVVGRELTRIPIPCRADRYTATEGPDTGWPTPEPPHRINQIYLEPILFACAQERPQIRILNRVRVEHFDQSADGVVAHARDLDSGQDHHHRRRLSDRLRRWPVGRCAG